MSLWYRGSGGPIKNGLGALIECATCPCVSTCPTCVECPGPYTVTFSGLTGAGACLNGVSIPLTALGTPCSWSSGTKVQACASCGGFPPVVSYAALSTCSAGNYTLVVFGSCLFGSGSLSFTLTKSGGACPTGSYSNGTQTAVVS